MHEPLQLLQTFTQYWRNGPILLRECGSGRRMGSFRLTGFVPWATLPAVIWAQEDSWATGVNNMDRLNPIDEAAILSMIDRLEKLYREFPWESRVWKREGVRRSPYRALILFGLSARTKDRLLVQICQGFFGRFPRSQNLLQGWDEGELDRFVRMGQKPFIESAAQVIRNHGGEIPQDKDGLKQIKGVGEKIAECVIAYGWGDEALPLDGNCCRVVERVCGFATGVPVQSLRGSLKNLYRDYRTWMEERGLAMVDLHEMIRLHAQIICAKAPTCSLCPVPTCLSRQAGYQADSFPEVNPAFWRGWRELLLEHGSVIPDED